MDQLLTEEQVKKEKAEDKLRNEISRFITLQLERDIDTVNAEKMWLQYLPKWMAESPAITAETLANAIVGKHCIRLSELLKGIRLG